MRSANLKAIRARAHARGFTLIELIVAMAAGLTVSLAAMLLSRNATKFFQSEARISATQLAATLGLNRLAADLQRAGFLSTPNIQADAGRCPQGNVPSWPDGLKLLSAVTIYDQGSVAAHSSELVQSTANGFTPDSIVIGGSFDTTEQFPVRGIVPGPGGGLDVFLQTDCGPVKRMLANQAQGAPAIADIFRAGRFLRIVDVEGKTEYGVIASVAVQGAAATPTNIIISLAATPVPQSHAGNTCGYTGHGVGIQVNPVSRVRYEIRSLVGDPMYGALVAPQSAALSGDAGRTELVRSELDPTGAEIQGTRELVAEYAVDLKFGLSAIGTGPNPAVAQRYAIPNAQVYTIAGEATQGSSTPQRIRSIQARLVTRARAPDRESDLPAGPDGRRSRFLVTAAPLQYARLRTVYADVALPNLAGVTW